MFTYISDRRQSCSHTSATGGSQVHTRQWQEAVKFTHVSDRRQSCSHISATGGSQVHTCQWQKAVKCPSVAKYCLTELISWMRSVEIMNFDLNQLHNEIWWPWFFFKTSVKFWNNSSFFTLFFNNIYETYQRCCKIVCEECFLSRHTNLIMIGHFPWRWCCCLLHQFQCLFTVTGTHNTLLKL